MTYIMRGKARVGYGVLIVQLEGKRPFGKTGGEMLQKIKNTTFWRMAQATLQPEDSNHCIHCRDKGKYCLRNTCYIHNLNLTTSDWGTVARFCENVKEILG